MPKCPDKSSGTTLTTLPSSCSKSSVATSGAVKPDMTKVSLSAPELAGRESPLPKTTAWSDATGVGGPPSSEIQTPSVAARNSVRPSVVTPDNVATTRDVDGSSLNGG